MSDSKKIEINGREYPLPEKPLVVICLDGCEPEYLDKAIAKNLMPNTAKMIAEGTRLTADSVIPSFTNPNNMSIATGSPPDVHGICGNFFYNRQTGEEVMMNDAKFLRAPTIFQKYYDQGKKIALVTAKDKLRALLGKGLKFDDARAICFSSEKSDTATLAEHGIDNASKWLGREVPEVYSAELSEFVFAAGVKLLNTFHPDVMYLSTTDYIQHKYAPGNEIADKFYAMFDGYLGQLLEKDISIVVTADHGMKPKHKADGTPDVIFLQDLFNEYLGENSARVILPITDPYVVHHGALGSFATAYLNDKANLEEKKLGEIIERFKAVTGMDEVLTKKQGIAKYHLAEDRVGDLIFLSKGTKTLGISADKHDFAMLKEPLRSHGGLDERTVPFIVNSKTISQKLTGSLNNFDAFYYAALCQ